MKKFFLFLVVFCCTFTLCCSPRATQPVQTTSATVRPPDTTEVRVWREFDLVLHVDTNFQEEGRRQIRAAADKWRDFTKGNVRIVVEFDLDFDSIENLREHRDRGDSLVIGALSDMPIVESIDQVVAGDPRLRPLAATLTAPGKPTLVFLIMDRIDPEHFQAVVTHELGHVIGLPDLPTLGAIMSGAEVPGRPVPSEFTAEDRALCRASHYCD